MNRKPTRRVSRPVHRAVTRDELRKERDERPKGKVGAAGAGGGPPAGPELMDNQYVPILG